MRHGESVADGIKRRMAEQAASQRSRNKLYIQIAMVTAAAGAAVLAVALASVLGGGGAH